MSEKILDFENRKESLIHQRKEAKVNALRAAFRKARGESPAKPKKQRKGRKNP